MTDVLNQAAAFVRLPTPLVVAGLATTAALAIGSAMRWMALRGATAAERNARMGSLAVWWGLVILTAVIMVTGPAGGALVFALASVVALVEYARMLDRLEIPRTGRMVVGLSIPALYGAALVGDEYGTVALSALAIALLLATRLILAGMTTGFLSSVGSLTWGMIVLVWCPAHVVLLLRLPGSSNPIGGAAGWLLFLIVFTECDDIFQALWGRRFGKRRIVPRVSPNKTWEGFLLGGVTAIGIGIAMAPWMTPLAEPWKWSLAGTVFQLPYCGAILIGVLLWFSGFLGDLNMSALKRDAGVKDSGNWLPGQGGILDRMDSLTFTAPTFYWFVYWFYA